MGTHVSDESLMDMLEGAGDAEARDHFRGCGACQERLEEARGGMSLAREAEVPEPPPLYWESFEKKLGRRLAEDRPRRWVPWTAAAALAAGLAVLAVRPPKPPEPVAPVAPVVLLPEWTPLPPRDEDAGLRVLQSVAAELEPETECVGVEECMADLSDEEGGALAELMRREAPRRAS